MGSAVNRVSCDLDPPEVSMVRINPYIIPVSGLDVTTIEMIHQRLI